MAKVSEEEKEEQLTLIRRVMRAMLIEMAEAYKRDHSNSIETKGLRIRVDEGTRGTGTSRFTTKLLVISRLKPNELIDTYGGANYTKRSSVAADWLTANHSNLLAKNWEVLVEDVLFSQTDSDDLIWAKHILQSIGIAKEYSEYTIEYEIFTPVKFSKTVTANSKEEAIILAREEVARYGSGYITLTPGMDPDLKVINISRT